MRFLALFLALALCAPLGAPLDAASFLYPISAPFRLYTDAQGKPLSGGFVYFGVANQNPETTPTSVFWDAAGTIPALQPIRTISGYASRNGTPANVFVSGDISTTVRDAGLNLLFTSPTSTDLQFAQAVLNTSSSAVGIGIADVGNFYTTKNVEAALQQAAGPGFVSLQSLTAAVQALLVPTGSIVDFTGTFTNTTAPPGYVFGSGQTIGSAASGTVTVPPGTHQRANADTQALYTLLWNSYDNTRLPIQDSTGTPTTRGASASADFTANKRLPTPDFRERVRVGLGNANNTTDPNRITSALNIDATIMGNAGGSQSHALTTPELSAHTHTIAHGHTGSTADAHTHGLPNGTGGNQVKFVDTAATAIGFATGSFGFTFVSSEVVNGPTLTANINTLTIAGSDAASSGSQGSGTAHSVVQPTIVCTVLIKL